MTFLPNNFRWGCWFAVEVFLEDVAGEFEVVDGVVMIRYGVAGGWK